MLLAAAVFWKTHLEGLSYRGISCIYTGWFHLKPFQHGWAMCFLLGTPPQPELQRAAAVGGVDSGDADRSDLSCEPDTVTDMLPPRRKKLLPPLRLATCWGDNSCGGSICPATTMSRLIMWHICLLFATKPELLTYHCNCVRWFNTIQMRSDGGNSVTCYSLPS